MNKYNKIGQKVGFIGCGKMASAIIKGILEAGFLRNVDIIASELTEEFAQAKSKELNIEVVTDNTIVARKSDVIFLAVKPHFIDVVLQQIKEGLTEDKLIVSIAAGVCTSTIEKSIGMQMPVIRVMPNAPMMILEGMSGIVRGKWATDEQVEFVESIFCNLGECILIDEDKIDVLTAISGSGPAFFYKILHEMALAGEELGLIYEDALLLAVQTSIGSAKLMLESALPAKQLIDNVATKGGCTEVGVNVMDERNTKELFYEIIKRTAEKSKALG